MNKQINLRLSEPMLNKATMLSKKQGFENLQEYIKQILREKLFETAEVTNKEMSFLKKLYKISEEKNLYGTEEKLFAKLNKK